MSYVYGADYAEERARLAGIEALWDPGSQALLEPLVRGRCLEVGGGGGSLAAWMAPRCEHLLVTDLDPRFLDGPYEVRRHDVTTDPLPDGEFDLIHSRLVLEHLPQRDDVLRRLVAALRPGGHLVIEDYDWTPFGFEPANPASARAAEAVLAFMAHAGFEATYGRRLASDFAAAGLVDVRGEGRVLSIDASSPGFAFFRLSFDSLRGAVVDAGLLSAADADEAAAKLGAGRVLTPLLMAAIGARPT